MSYKEITWRGGKLMCEYHYEPAQKATRIDPPTDERIEVIEAINEYDYDIIDDLTEAAQQELDKKVLEALNEYDGI